MEQGFGLWGGRIQEAELKALGLEKRQGLLHQVSAAEDALHQAPRATVASRGHGRPHQEAPLLAGLLDELHPAAGGKPARRHGRPDHGLAGFQVGRGKSQSHLVPPLGVPLEESEIRTDPPAHGLQLIAVRRRDLRKPLEGLDVGVPFLSGPGEGLERLRIELPAGGEVVPQDEHRLEAPLQSQPNGFRMVLGRGAELGFDLLSVRHPGKEEARQAERRPGGQQRESARRAVGAGRRGRGLHALSEMSR